MRILPAIFVFALALELTDLAAAQQVKKPPMVVQFEWSISCSPGSVGADGQSLCSAFHLGYPNLTIFRTDTGLRLLTTADCGRAPNKLGKDVPAYRKIGINVDLKPNAAVDEIQRLIMLNLKDFPQLIRKACPTSHNDGGFDVNQSQLPMMINSVFVIKQARY